MNWEPATFDRQPEQRTEVPPSGKLTVLPGLVHGLEPDAGETNDRKATDEAKEAQQAEVGPAAVKRGEGENREEAGDEDDCKGPPLAHECVPTFYSPSELRLARRLAHFEEEMSLAEQPVVQALAEVGVEVQSVWDLVNTSSDYSQAVPVLQEHLQDATYPAAGSGRGDGRHGDRGDDRRVSAGAPPGCCREASDVADGHRPIGRGSAFVHAKIGVSFAVRPCRIRPSPFVG